MAILTRCTSCRTIFHVQNEQLSASDGWARCSHCGAVFDAQANVVKSAKSGASKRMATPKTSARTTAKHSAAYRNELASRELAGHDKTLGVQSPDSTAGMSAIGRRAPSKQISHPAQGQLELSDTPSFIKQARSAARWNAPVMRLALSLCILGLLAALVAQVAWREKDRLAASFPALKPMLTAACGGLGCKIEPYKGIDAVVVDSTSFVRAEAVAPTAAANQQQFQFSIQIKNRASYPVAVPHVELSLQDAQDQTIIRRILTPSDLSIERSELAGGSETTGSTWLRVDSSEAGGKRVQGYRALAFYP